MIARNPKAVSKAGAFDEPVGFFLIEVARGYEEDATPGEWEAMHWPTARKLAEELAKVGKLALEAARDPAPYAIQKSLSSSCASRLSREPAQSSCIATLRDADQGACLALDDHRNCHR